MKKQISATKIIREPAPQSQKTGFSTQGSTSVSAKKDNPSRATVVFVLIIGVIIFYICLSGRTNNEPKESLRTGVKSNNTSDMPGAWRQAGKSEYEWEKEKEFRKVLFEAAQKMDGK